MCSGQFGLGRMLISPKELMKIQCLPVLRTSSQKSMLGIRLLHSDGLWLWCLHRAENYTSKGDLSFSPLKTLDSHICCFLDPELSIFSPDKNVFFFLFVETAGVAWKLGPGGSCVLHTCSWIRNLHSRPGWRTLHTESYRVAF